MDAIGIISEYNPLHGGHVYHIRQSLAAAGPDKPVVCVMSGSVTQRGDLACMTKWIRARAAVLNGADLVLELPAPYACASADNFARGAVYLLNASGVVGTLSFGSECGDIASLEQALEALEHHNVKEIMSEGVCYPKALSGASDETLKGANNTLGICYIKALRALGSHIKPITIKRSGAGHDEVSAVGFPSAKELREQLFSGKSAAHLCGEGEIISLGSHERLVLAALRSMELDEWRALEEVSEGLEHRLYASARAAKTLDGLYAAVKTKRYTMARIRRIILRAYLGIPKISGPPPYLRVLAFSGGGAKLLKRMKKTASVPVITKPASYRELDAVCREIFGLEIKITDRIAMHCAEPWEAGMELRKSPFSIK